VGWGNSGSGQLVTRRRLYYRPDQQKREPPLILVQVLGIYCFDSRTQLG
jgi:hypothetical protein